MNSNASIQREQATQAVETFLQGLVKSNVEDMPFAPDVVFVSPLDPEHPKRGRAEVFEFLQTRVFPGIPVQAADVQKHIVEGEYVATRWQATFKDPSGSDVLVPIFDFFRITEGLIKEARFFFDPKPLQDILQQA